MSGLYRLAVGITLKDETKGGLASLERNAAAAQQKAEALQKTMRGLEDSGQRYDSRITAQEKIVQFSRQEVELRKTLAVTTDVEEKSRIEGELKALGLMKQELGVRKQELTLQDKLLGDGFKEQQRNAKAQEADVKALASLEMRNQKELADNAYRAQKEQESRDLASIKLINDARKQAERDSERFREERREQRSGAIEDHLNGLLSSRSAAYDAHEARREEIGSSLNLGAGIAAGIGSHAIFGAMKQGVQSGADMQSDMITTQIATNSSNAQMEGFRNQAFQIADQTAQSATDAMKNISIIAGAGLNDPNQLRALAPEIAKFADVQFLKNHVSFDESAKQGVQLAHLFGAYSADKMNPILEKLTAVSFAMPDNLNRFLTQAGYYEPIFRGAGVSDADSIQAGAIIDRVGMGRGKGGSALGNIVLDQMNALAQTGHVQKGREKGLQLLGLSNSDGTSKFYKWSSKDQKNEFDILGAIEQVNKTLHYIPDKLTDKEKTAYQAKRFAAINQALGLTGERAALAINQEAIDNLSDALNRVTAGSGGDPKHLMENIQHKYMMGSLSAQESRFKGNLDSLYNDVMWPWQDQLRKGFMWMGDQAHDLQAWFHTHRDAATTLSIGLAGIGAALAVYSGATMWGAIAGLSALNRSIALLGQQSLLASGEITTAEVTIGVSGAAIAGAATLVATGIAAVNYAVRHFDPHPELHHGIVGGQQALPATVQATGLALYKQPTVQALALAVDKLLHGDPSGRPIRDPGDTHFNFSGNIIVQGSTPKQQAADILKQLQYQAQSAKSAGLGQAGPTISRYQAMRGG